MFLLRMMFWLSVLVFLIPTDQTSGSQKEVSGVTVDGAIGAAAATVSDLSGFCERNGSVCETGSAAVELFLAKAENGARLAYKMLADVKSDRTGPGADDGEAALREAAWREIETAQSSDTLTTADRSIAWRGPAAP